MLSESIGPLPSESLVTRTVANEARIYRGTIILFANLFKADTDSTIKRNNFVQTQIVVMTSKQTIASAATI